MKKKISIFIIGLVIVLTSISLSYAYWKTTIMGDKGNNVTSGCFNVEMINQKDEITLGSTFPITDAEGLKLKPFSFTLKNTCTIFAHYYVNMEMLEGTTLNSKWVATKVNSDAITTLDKYKTATTTMTGSTEARTIAEGYLGADEEVDYTVSFWMDEDATIDDDVMNKVFKSKIVINSEPGKYDPVSAGYNKLGEAILANEYQTTPAIAKTKIAAKQTVDITNTAPVIKWGEKTGGSSTRQVIKPTAEAISSVTQLSGLGANEQYMYICTTKSFNSENAIYSLENCSLKDPTTLDYSGDTKYYYSYETMAYNQTNSKLYVARNNGDITVFQITGATKTTSTQTISGITYATNVYNLSCITLTETELETDKSDKGLYQAADDYGTTYYYRGNVKNNIVSFAGFYWQIVRINGDGSIRLMYDGAVKNASGVNQSINNRTYQFNSKYNDPAYVGYMYGNPDGTTFDEVHTNTTSSTIKTTVDNWYKTNIVDKGYSNYVSNAVGFCGDRTLTGGDGISTSNYSDFGALGRHYSQTAIFTCPNKERDLYTTTDSSIGNKALTYPVGLITYDELVFAGMDSRHVNKLSWVYSTQHYWTMSPSGFDASYGVALELGQNSVGGFLPWAWIHATYGARPVINLKSDVKITEGIGTANDPFIVETN